MNKLRKRTIIAVGTIALSVVVLMGALGFMTSTGVLAQASSPTPSTSAPSTASTSNNIIKYWDYFWTNLAQQLNLDVSALKSAAISAANATIDQAVKDAILSQTESDNLKAKVSDLMSQGPSENNGIPFLFGRGNGADRAGGRGTFVEGVSLSPVEFAKALNMTEQELMTELQTGKSINDVAKEKNIDAATVKSTVLADVKSQLDSAVSSGKITQAQADQMVTNASNQIDGIMSQTVTAGQNWKGMPGGKNNGSSSGGRFNRNGSSDSGL
jgi:hypothetical protein